MRNMNKIHYTLYTTHALKSGSDMIQANLQNQHLRHLF